MNISLPRFQNIHEDKKNGVTYTPIELAEFVAKKTIGYFDSQLFLNKKIKRRIIKWLKIFYNIKSYQKKHQMNL